MSRPQMSSMPAHGNASRVRAGNGNNVVMAGGYTPGMAGGRIMEQMCQFPQPPPKRCYCHPAAFTSLNGASHFKLLDAYGHSMPCQANY